MSVCVCMCLPSLATCCWEWNGWVRGRDVQLKRKEEGNPQVKGDSTSKLHVGRNCPNGVHLSWRDNQAHCCESIHSTPHVAPHLCSFKLFVVLFFPPQSP